jgi:hypothetical protein
MLLSINVTGPGGAVGECPGASASLPVWARPPGRCKGPRLRPGGAPEEVKPRGLFEQGIDENP